MKDRATLEAPRKVKGPQEEGPPFAGGSKLNKWHAQVGSFFELRELCPEEEFRTRSEFEERASSYHLANALAILKARGVLGGGVAFHGGMGGGWGGWGGWDDDPTCGGKFRCVALVKQ